VTAEDRISQLENRVKALEAFIAQMRAVFTGSTGDAAPDRELDSPHGDPQVKVIPRDWVNSGVFKGQKFSTCNADFLDALAEMYMFFAERNDAKGEMAGNGTPKSVYDRKSARIARGWARRIRDGWTPPPAPTFGASAPADPNANPFSSKTNDSNPFARKANDAPAPAPSGNEEEFNW
jgi:hypothetical protein